MKLTGSGWSVFESQEPDLARTARLRVHGRICYLATVRKDGSPRVFPVGGCVGHDRIWLFVGEDSPKRYDLRNDGRIALHCGVEDSRGGAGEIHITGHAAEVTDQDERAAAISVWPGGTVREEWLLFIIEPLSVTSKSYQGDSAVTSSWRAE